MTLTTTSKDFQVGQSIFIIPLGNYAQRGSAPIKEQIKEVIVEKITKTKITLINGDTFNIFGEQDKYNGGYLPFTSKEKALEYIDMKNYLNNLKYNVSFNEWNQEDVVQLKQIIDKIDSKYKN